MGEEMNGLNEAGVAGRFHCRLYLLSRPLISRGESFRINIQMCKSPSVWLEHSKYLIHGGWQQP